MSYLQRAWTCLEVISEKLGVEYEYVVIEPYMVGSDGSETKTPLPLEEKAARYPEFVRASPRCVLGVSATVWTDHARRFSACASEAWSRLAGWYR